MRGFTGAILCLQFCRLRIRKFKLGLVTSENTQVSIYGTLKSRNLSYESFCHIGPVSPTVCNNVYLEQSVKATAPQNSNRRLSGDHTCSNR